MTAYSNEALLLANQRRGGKSGGAVIWSGGSGSNELRGARPKETKAAAVPRCRYIRFRARVAAIASSANRMHCVEFCAVSTSIQMRQFSHLWNLKFLRGAMRQGGSLLPRAQSEPAPAAPLLLHPTRYYERVAVMRVLRRCWRAASTGFATIALKGMAPAKRSPATCNTLSWASGSFASAQARRVSADTA